MSVVRRLTVCALAAALALVPGAAEGGSRIRLVDVIETSAWDPPSPDPSGIAYSPSTGRLFVTDGEVEETIHFRGANVFRATRRGALLGAFDLTEVSREPAGVAVRPRSRRALYVADDNANRIFFVRSGPDRRWGTDDDRVRSISTRAFGSDDAEGLAYGERSLFVADGGNAEIIRIVCRDRCDGPPPGGDDDVRRFDTAPLGLTDPEGVDLDRSSGHLFIVSRRERLIAETTLGGRLVARYDVSSSPIRHPSGIAVVRRRDGGRTLYVLDRGVDNDQDPAENDGRIFVFSIA
ncbi:MAG TPA: hypothetical protein VNO17_00375 [Actinomycetota bacterium]|nr:hypothetical protein [Actinomycetota bacterium]